MNTNRPAFVLRLNLLATCAVALTLAHASIGQVPGAAPSAIPAPIALSDPSNAALVYSKAWLLMPEGFEKNVGEAYADREKPWNAGEPLNKELENAQEAIETLLRASKLSTADFGLEYSQGLSMLIPHLAKMRASARVLMMDIRRLQGQGQTDAAVDRACAMFGLSVHCSGDRVLISSLVSAAIHELASVQVEQLLASGKITQSQRDRLLIAAKRFQKADPFGVRQGVQYERQWACEWLRAQAKGPNAAAKFDELQAAFGPGSEKQIEMAKAMNPAALETQFDQASRVYDQIVEAIDDPNGLERLKSLEPEIKAGTHGVIAQIIVPAFSRTFSSNQKAKARRDEIIAKLESFVPIPG